MLPAQFAGMHGVDRSTVARWLLAIYAQLLSETRKSLRHHLHLTEDGLQSLVRAMHSHLHDNLEAMLREGT